MATFLKHNLAKVRSEFKAMQRRAKRRKANHIVRSVVSLRHDLELRDVTIVHKTNGKQWATNTINLVTGLTFATGWVEVEGIGLRHIHVYMPLDGPQRIVMPGSALKLYGNLVKVDKQLTSINRRIGEATELKD